MTCFHQPVLLKEIIDYLALKSNQNVIDCTIGGGGHAEEILKHTAPGGKLLGIDLDPKAIERAKQYLDQYSQRTRFVCDNYKNIDKNKKYVLADVQINGILCDLGLSSAQLQDSRGFSFRSQESFDLRFGPGVGKTTAGKIVNTYSEHDLIKIFLEYGEEKLARPIAQSIIAYRRQHKIEKPAELASIVREIYQRKFKSRSRRDPATKVFQALRIAVNQELDNLKNFLPAALQALTSGGRLAVITYQGLEDRIMKEFIRTESRDCICPAQAPLCTCGHRATISKVTRKPIKPTAEEIRKNPRARSAKLWVIEKT